MRIIEVATPGGPEKLKIAQAAIPACDESQVLIKVVAAGLNRADILQRRGHYPSPPGAPSNPGLEIAGTVVAVGRDVADFNERDAVCALLAGGGYSEYCAVDARQVLHVPGAVDLIHAAALPEASFTVWSNLYEFARLEQGESVLIHGGSSGIGSFAIQLASALGSRVYATVGSEDKATFCERLGAHAINYKSHDFVAEVTRLTGGRGVDVILDMVGGNYLERNLQALADQGRLVIIAAQGGSKAQIDLMQVMRKRVVLTGSMLRARSIEFKREIRDKLAHHVWPLLQAGRVRPIIDRIFAFEDVAAAHTYMDAGAHKGKILLSLRA
jgi:NADPH2:quinone reductase